MEISWSLIQEKYSIVQPFSEYFKHIGIPFIEIMKAIGVNNKLIEIKNDYFSYTHENIEKIKAYDHSYDIFHILKNKNITTGIITSKEKKIHWQYALNMDFHQMKLSLQMMLKKGNLV